MTHNSGLEIDGCMLKLQGRVLPPPTIRYKGGKAVQLSKHGGSWNILTCLMRKPGTLQRQRWAVMSITDETRRGLPAEYNAHYQAYVKSLRSRGLKVSSQPIKKKVSIKDLTGLEEMMQDLASQQRGNRGIEFTLMILPPKLPRNLIDKIRYFGNVVFGLKHQCIDLQKSTPHFFSDVMLKTNLKLGGVNHVVAKKDLGFIAEGKTMIIGADVCHPIPGTDRPSVAACVANIDTPLAQWPSESRLQWHPRGRKGSSQEVSSTFASQYAFSWRLGVWKLTLHPSQQIILQLAPMIKIHLERFLRHNQRRPENILYYRDGVSEGQFNAILSQRTRPDQIRLQGALSSHRASAPHHSHRR